MGVKSRRRSSGIRVEEEECVRLRTQTSHTVMKPRSTHYVEKGWGVSNSVETHYEVTAAEDLAVPMRGSD